MNNELWIMAQLAYLNKKSKNGKWQKQMKAKVTENIYRRLEKKSRTLIVRARTWKGIYKKIESYTMEKHRDTFLDVSQQVNSF